MTKLKASAKAEAFAKRHNAAIAAKQVRWAEDEARRRVRAERVAPTEQRLSKGDLQKVAYDGGLRYRPKDDLLRLRQKCWKPQVVQAFFEIQNDSFAADIHGVTASYEARDACGKGPSGGLTDASAQRQAAFARITWVKPRLTPESRQVIERFILNEVPLVHREEVLLKLGKSYRPDVVDKRSLLFLAEGRICAAGEELAHLHEAYEMEKRGRAVRK